MNVLYDDENIKNLNQSHESQNIEISTMPLNFIVIKVLFSSLSLIWQATCSPKILMLLETPPVLSMPCAFLETFFIVPMQVSLFFCLFSSSCDLQVGNFFTSARGFLTWCAITVGKKISKIELTTVLVVHVMAYLAAHLIIESEASDCYSLDKIFPYQADIDSDNEQSTWTGCISQPEVLVHERAPLEQLWTRLFSLHYIKPM